MPVASEWKVIGERRHVNDDKPSCLTVIFCEKVLRSFCLGYSPNSRAALVAKLNILRTGLPSMGDSSVTARHKAIPDDKVSCLHTFSLP